MPHIAFVEPDSALADSWPCTQTFFDGCLFLLLRTSSRSKAVYAKVIADATAIEPDKMFDEVAGLATANR